jgi:predicted DCC family thiol-disulfide oxidoreductase YuxK
VANATVFYDEDCGFCRWSADRLRRWDRDGRLRFAPIQGEEGDRWLAPIDPAVRLDAMHLVTPDGRVRSGGAALPPLVRGLPYGRPVAALLDLSPAATDRLYRWVARHRIRLGAMLGQEACAVDPGRPRSAP